MKFEITQKGTKSERLNQQTTKEELISLYSANPEEIIEFESFSEIDETKSLFSWKYLPVKFVAFLFISLEKLNQLREYAGGFNADILKPLLEDSENSASAYKKAGEEVILTTQAALDNLGLMRRSFQ
jgi:hypothetical protein